MVAIMSCSLLTQSDANKLIFEIQAKRLECEDLSEYDRNLKDWVYCNGTHHVRTNGIDEIFIGLCPDKESEIAVNKLLNDGSNIRIDTDMKYRDSFKPYMDTALVFIENNNSKVLAIIGRIGVGKTTFAKYIQLELIKKHYSVEFIIIDEFSKLLMKSEPWNNDAEERNLARRKLDKLRMADFVIIDDLGKNVNDAGNRLSSEFFILLETRKGKLIYTSNLAIVSSKKFSTIPELKRKDYLNSKYEPRIISRLLHNVVSITMKGSDKRVN